MKEIFFENNNQTLKIIITNNEYTIIYNNTNNIQNNNQILTFQKKLQSIILDWKEDYTISKFIDGNNWKLKIKYNDDKKKIYKGNYKPYNFNAVENLFNSIINGDDYD